jgi:serine/threonine protein kinase
VFVAFLGWFQTESAMYLAMEYIPLGDLENNLQELEKSRNTEGQTNRHNGGVLSEGEVKDITMQILEGVKIMHSEGFAHRDLKPQVGSPQLQPSIWHPVSKV